MKSYSNWSSGTKWLLGLLSGGVVNILRKTIDNATNAAIAMKDERKNSEKAFEEDIVSDIGDVYNSTSDNSFLSYRNDRSMPDFSSDVDNPWSSWWNSKTGAGITESERIKMMYQTWERQQAENTAHNEAVDARNYEMYMAQNKYQFETQSMAAAGVNPALVYGGGSLVPTAATGAAGSSSPQSAPSSPTTGSLSGLVDLLSTIMRLPLEMKAINADIARSKADAVRSEKEGDAAMMNAATNKQNADINQQNADTNKENAATNRLNADIAERRLQIERMVADSNIKLNDQQIATLAAHEQEAIERIKQIPIYAQAEMMKASAAVRSAYAAVMNAKAALQNADTNSKLADSQIMLNSILTSKEEVNLEWLPAEKRAQVEEARARGYFFNQQGDLVDKQGKLVDANTARAYVGLGCDIVNAGCNAIGTALSGGLLGGSTPKIGF